MSRRDIIWCLTGQYCLKIMKRFELRGITFSSKILKNQILNPKSQIPNPKFQIQNPKFQIPNSKFQIPNSKSEIQNPKSEIRNPESRINESRIAILPNSRFLHPSITLGKTCVADILDAGIFSIQNHP